MDRSKIKFWVDVLMFIGFISLAISGYILKFILPRGTNKTEEEVFLLLRHQWLDLHALIAGILVILLLIHLILNWNWIKCMFKRTFIRI